MNDEPNPRKFRLFRDHSVTVSTDIAEEIDKVRDHFKRNKTAYSFVGGAVFTYFVMKGIPTPGGGGALGVAAQAEHSVKITPVSLFSNRMTSNITTVIESGRQGPPSWVVRCLETGDVFTSQRAAAIANGISETNLSQHLNGIQDAVNGLTFERICMAA